MRAMTPDARSAAFGRWALLVVTLAMGAALLGTSLASWAQARRAANQVVVGQVAQLRGAAARSLRGEADLQAGLDELLEDLAGYGLLYVAAIDRDGGVLAQAGEGPTGGLPASLRALRPDRFRRIDGKVQVLGVRGGRRRPRPPGRVLLEFEPVIANALLVGARRTLAAGVVAALGLLGLSILAWRASVRAELTAVALHKERHLAALGEMSAVLGHEIRNPLTSLKGHAQLLARKAPPGSPLAEKADWVLKEALRLERLTNRILDFARSGSTTPVPTSPAALLQDLVPRIADPRLRVHCDELPDWPLDSDWMPQALENIVRNALQASGPDSPVDLRASLEGRKLVFAVRDGGPGFPEDLLPHAFEPFRTTRTQGTGLGLAIARRVAEQHNGTIEARNHADGAEVRIILEPRP
jgi:two-component system sensor histidine kinase HydH